MLLQTTTEVRAGVAVGECISVTAVMNIVERGRSKFVYDRPSLHSYLIL